MHLKNKGNSIIYILIILMILSTISLYSISIYNNNEKKNNISYSYKDIYKNTNEEEEIICYINSYSKENKELIKEVMESKEGIDIGNKIILRGILSTGKISARKLKVGAEDISIILDISYKEDEVILLREGVRLYK